LKPEQWGSPLVQEKYQEEKAYDKRHPYHIIIIIIIHHEISAISRVKNNAFHRFTECIQSGGQQIHHLL